MKVYEITLTPQQLATIQVALESEIEHLRDAARDTDDPEVADTMLTSAHRSEVLWIQLSRVPRDFALVER